MNRIKGILYAAVSSSTFGLAPGQRNNLRDSIFKHII